MSGPLNHPPQRILQQLLVDQGLALATQDDEVSKPNLPWPSFVGNLPDSPDNCLRVADSEGRVEGREHVTGLVFEQYGCQIMVRSNGPSDGYVKGATILQALDKLHNAVVTVADESGTATTDYRVQAISRPSTVMRLGPERTGRRYLWALNVLLSVRMIE